MSTPPASTFLIGELAARSGRSIHTIRWYEAQGLIPGVVRDAGGRRNYTEQHVDWLDLMDRLRRTGMSVAEMRDYAALVKLGRATLRQRQELLAAHRVKVRATIAEMSLALKLIDSKIDFYGEWLHTGQRPKLIPSLRNAEGKNGEAARRIARRAAR
jgi:DNA-binding transcriptional MerR regulator